VPQPPGPVELEAARYCLESITKTPPGPITRWMLLICEWDSRSIGFWVVCADRLLLAGCGELAHE